MRSIILLSLFISISVSQNYSWKIQKTNTTASFRGISAISSDICWVSGSNGTIIKTTNAGETWEKLTIPTGADSIDFRDIQAFSSRVAYAMSAGPGETSKIYKTIDGGKSWQHQFTNTYKDGFFTAISFWNESHGIVLSDPVEGTHYILTTEDGGKSWNRVDPKNIPKTVKDEYGFAASGSNMTIREGGHVWIGSGGSKARVFYSSDYGKNWIVYGKTPITQGDAPKGIFSLLFTSDKRGIAVGGNYSSPTDSLNNVMISDDSGKTWRLTKNPIELPYRSAIKQFPESGNLIVVGRTGSNSSKNAGENWNSISNEGFYTVDFGKSENSGWAAGPRGKVAKLIEKESH